MWHIKLKMYSLVLPSVPGDGLFNKRNLNLSLADRAGTQKKQTVPTSI